MEVHYDAGGLSVRDTEALNEEYVVLKNIMTSPVNLNGWVIRDKTDHACRFLSGTLQLRQEIVLHTDKGVNTAHTGVLGEQYETVTIILLTCTIRKGDW